jgi:hypothetical protein
VDCDVGEAGCRATEILSAITHFPLSRALAKSDHLVTAGLQVMHVIGSLLLLASLRLISLRLLGRVPASSSQ